MECRAFIYGQQLFTFPVMCTVSCCELEDMLLLGGLKASIHFDDEEEAGPGQRRHYPHQHQLLHNITIVAFLFLSARTYV